MTPIQQHQDELIAIATDAGFEVDRDCLPHVIHGSTDAYMLHVGEAEGWFRTCYAGVGERTAEFQKRGVYHPDPRVALRTCLEMAGLLKSPLDHRINQAIAALKIAYDKARHTDDPETQAMVDGIARILLDQPAKNFEGVSFEAKLYGLDGLQTFIDAVRKSDGGKS